VVDKREKKEIILALVFLFIYLKYLFLSSSFLYRKTPVFLFQMAPGLSTHQFLLLNAYATLLYLSTYTFSVEKATHP
jgi:hypothetical protein